MSKGQYISGSRTFEKYDNIWAKEEVKNQTAWQTSLSFRDLLDWIQQDMSTY